MHASHKYRDPALRGATMRRQVQGNRSAAWPGRSRCSLGACVQVEEAFVLPFRGSTPRGQKGEPGEGWGWDGVLKGLGTATLGRMMNVTTTLARGGELPTKQANKTAGATDSSNTGAPREKSAGAAGAEASKAASRKRVWMKQGKVSRTHPPTHPITLSRKHIERREYGRQGDGTGIPGTRTKE